MSLCSGQVEKAIEILENLRKVIPSSAHVYFRLINLHRRRGNISECLKLFQDFIEDRKDAPEVAHIKIKYARFLAKVRPHELCLKKKFSMEVSQLLVFCLSLQVNMRGP